jgi:5-formyltetrahydrofolate cyclo-ligase
MTDNVLEAKQRLRKNILSLRTAQPSSSAHFSKALIDLCEKLNAQTVGCYLSFGSEPDTSQFISDAQAKGIKIVCPKIGPAGAMHFALLTKDLRRNELGIEEPTGPWVEKEDIDLIVVPALGVDPMGFRLGRGGGYFDRYLENIQTLTVALIYDDEFLEEIPVEQHDRAISFAISPSRTTSFAQKS